jgi:hypothetical protein
MRSYLQGDTEEDLNQKLGLYFQQCGVVLIIIDEVEHISHPEMKRRVLDLSNRTQGVPFICASCNPTTWVMGDEEVAGRWNDFFELPPYTGARLSTLLASLELLLPFTQPSNLALPVIKDKSGEVDGPAKFIELMTGGILRDIMILIRDASRRAIEADLPCLTPELLEKTWKKIQRKKATEFLEQSEMARSVGVE